MNAIRYVLPLAIMIVYSVLMVLPLRLLVAHPESSACEFVKGLVHQHGVWFVFAGYVGYIIMVGLALMRLQRRTMKILGL